MNSGQLRELTLFRLLLFLREPEAVFWVFLFPVVLALVLGIAFKDRGIENIPVGIIEGTLNERWERAIEEAEGLQAVIFDDPALAARKLRGGAVAAMLQGQEQLQLRYDPSRPESETARLRIEDAIQRAEGRSDPVLVATETVNKKGSRYIDFLIPGLLGMNLMGTGIWGSGFSIVDMRQKKMLKLLMVTPMRKPLFLLAQMFSRFAFLVAEVAVITLFGALALGVPFRGSFLVFSLLCALGGLGFSGMGLLIASRAQTLEGASGLMNFIMMPMWLLSGVFFSYEKFPEVFHPFLRLLPLTALNDGLRKLMLEGDGLIAIGPEILVLIVWGVLCFTVALRIFRWR